MHEKIASTHIVRTNRNFLKYCFFFCLNLKVLPERNIAHLVWNFWLLLQFEVQMRYLLNQSLLRLLREIVIDICMW